MRYTEITEDDIPAGVRFDLAPETSGKLVEVYWGGFSGRKHPAGSAFKKVLDRTHWERPTTKYFRAAGWQEIGEHERASNQGRAAGKKPNKASEPTPGSVTPRASD